MALKLLANLGEATQSTRPEKVRLVVSSLTDTRFLKQRLAEVGVEVEHDRVSMASGERREYFQELQEKHDWQGLPMVFADGEFIGGELELLQRLPTAQRLAPSSPVAWCLALSGLIPFVAMALLFWFGSLPFGLAINRTFLWSYGPIILSFMAAVQWGAALALPGSQSQSRWYAFSVLPALAAWFALAIYLAGNALLATGIVAAGFVAVFIADAKALKKDLLPCWYLRLRIVLTASVLFLLSVVMVALLLGK